MEDAGKSVQCQRKKGELKGGSPSRKRRSRNLTWKIESCAKRKIVPCSKKESCMRHGRQNRTSTGSGQSEGKRDYEGGKSPLNWYFSWHQRKRRYERAQGHAENVGRKKNPRNKHRRKVAQSQKNSDETREKTKPYPLRRLRRRSKKTRGVTLIGIRKKKKGQTIISPTLGIHGSDRKDPEKTNPKGYYWRLRLDKERKNRRRL